MLCAAAMVSAACSEEEHHMILGSASGFQQVALEFTRTLASREYDRAYMMTSGQYRRQYSMEQLRADFEAILPVDWGTPGPIEVAHTMTSWPGRQAADLGWAYVSIGGDVYSEAVTVVVTSEDGVARVREIEFGRP